MLALIVAELHESMPAVFGKEAKKRSLIKHLEQTIEVMSLPLPCTQAVELRHGPCTGDLPPLDTLRDTLTKADWSRWVLHPLL